MSYQFITEYMSRLVDSLKIDSAYVMGLSDGGIVGILLAEKRPDKIKELSRLAPTINLRVHFLPRFH